MGQNMAYELIAEIPDPLVREGVLSLSGGAYSDVAVVPGGWAIYRCDEAARPVDNLDSAQTQKIKNYIMGSERGRVEDWCLARADNFIDLAKSSGDFEDAVRTLGLIVQSFGPLPLNYGQYEFASGSRNNPFGSEALLSSFNIPELNYAGANENFWMEAFSTPLNTPSKPIVQDDNVLVLYPESETDAGESVLENIPFTYEALSQDFIQQDLRTQILSSPHFQNRFDTTFSRLTRSSR
jgi:hypothetical protein